MNGEEEGSSLERSRGECLCVVVLERERVITRKKEEGLSIYRNLLQPHAQCTGRVVLIQLGQVKATCLLIGWTGLCLLPLEIGRASCRERVCQYV